MGMLDDPFFPSIADSLADEAQAGDLALPSTREAGTSHIAPAGSVPVLARLHGFDLLDRPLLSKLAGDPSLVTPARSIVALRRAMVGSEVLVFFIDGDPEQPVIGGVLQAPASAASATAPGVTVQVDDERHVISAEREIVLRCGDASITLTRAGKVLIKGNYILSRASGCNRIKGGAVDIN